MRGFGSQWIPSYPVLYLFHMPVFLMASGYCFNRAHAQNPAALGRYIGKKVKALYLPYLLFNGVFILLYNLLLRWNIYTDHPVFSAPMARKSLPELWAALNAALHFEPGATQQLCGADWFVIILFYITILFAVACWLSGIFRRRCLQNGFLGFSAVAAVCLGFILQKKNLSLEGFWTPAITGFALYALGFFLAQLPPAVDQFMEKAKWAIAVLGIVFLSIASHFGSISLNVNHYTDPIFLVLCSLVGWYWLQALANIFKSTKPVAAVFTCLSRSSLFILFLHFLSFKIVTALQLAIYAEPAYLLASFPILHTEGLWWIAYTVAGVLIPVAAKHLFDLTMCAGKRLLVRLGLLSPTPNCSAPQ